MSRLYHWWHDSFATKLCPFLIPPPQPTQKLCTSKSGSPPPRPLHPNRTGPGGLSAQTNIWSPSLHVVRWHWAKGFSLVLVWFFVCCVGFLLISCTRLYIESWGMCTEATELFILREGSSWVLTHFQHLLFTPLTARQVCLCAYTVQRHCRLWGRTRAAGSTLLITWNQTFRLFSTCRECFQGGKCSRFDVLNSSSWSVMEETTCTYGVDWIVAEEAALCRILVTLERTFQ